MNWVSGKWYKTRGGEAVAQIISINTDEPAYPWILAHLFKNGQYMAVQTYDADGLVGGEVSGLDLLGEEHH